MTPGERIRLIKECADSLNDRPWADAQLTLRTFGFRTYHPDEYDFDPRSYFIEQVEAESDESVARLHAFLAGEDAAPTGSPGASPWSGHGLNVFISHISAHKVWVSELKDRLAGSGIDGFVAHEDIEPSQHWRGVIQDALATCHACVVVIHDGFHESQWCDQEVGWALSRNVPVVPIDLTSVAQPHGFLADVQFINGREHSPLDLADNIWRVLHGDPRTQAPARDAVIESLVNSWNYNRTRQLWQRIEAFPSLTSDQLRRLEYAATTNGQVRDANYGGRMIPDLIENLVLRFEPPPF